MKTLQAIRAFILGLREFRQSTTTHFDEDLIEAYDTGRDLAHRLTFRQYEDSI